MSQSPNIVRRKDEHIDIALAQGSNPAGEAPFDRIRFEHCALPEMHLDEVRLETTFLGFSLRLPFLISSMTGGPQRGSSINENLATAAEALGIALAVGSQRVALERAGAGGLTRALRRHAPTIPIFANLGAAQFAAGWGVEEARQALDMIGADALIVHLNPLQEAVQSGGDRNWSGVLAAIQRLATDLPAPVIVKEVGFGLSGTVARRLRDAGAAAIDVSGAGGTDWASIEAARASSAAESAVALAFAGWGIPTPRAIADARAACPALPLIGSGGIRNGVDAAKTIRLGADLVGQAGGVLSAALVSSEAVIAHFDVMARQLAIACFCTGSRTLHDLRLAPLLDP
jgi:isopentenyl-diphosphate delta-isomerase